MSNHEVDIYTDGSCHTQLKVGAWAAILFAYGQSFSLSGIVQQTTHNAMEILAVIKAFEFLEEKYPEVAVVTLFTDSQYVVGLLQTPKKTNDFFSPKAKRNDALAAQLQLLAAGYLLRVEKVKAHVKALPDHENYNRNADKLCRKIMREAVQQMERK